MPDSHPSDENAWCEEAASHICELARAASARGDERATSILHSTAALMRALHEQQRRPAPPLPKMPSRNTFDMNP
jgi:hypothetical protein